MDWLTALPIIFAALTALYAVGWVFTRSAGGRSEYQEQERFPCSGSAPNTPQMSEITARPKRFGG